jgi:hypothetical protein
VQTQSQRFVFVEHGPERAEQPASVEIPPDSVQPLNWQRQIPVTRRNRDPALSESQGVALPACFLFFIARFSVPLAVSWHFTGWRTV